MPHAAGLRCLRFDVAQRLPQLPALTGLPVVGQATFQGQLCTH